MPLWLIGLWKNPVVRYAAFAVAVLVLVTGWTKYHRFDAAREARAECEADSLRETLALERKRKAVAEKIAEEAQARAALTAKQMDELEAEAHELLESIGEDGSCDMPDDFLDRLRRIQ